MTRFARAKGSKASNERVPESATPWDVMKSDLKKTQSDAKQQTARLKMNKERQEKYDEFVEGEHKKKGKKWAEIPPEFSGDELDPELKEKIEQALKDESPEERPSKKRKNAAKNDDRKDQDVLVLKHKRRKPDLEDAQSVVINGEKLLIKRYDGFPVLEKDFDNLQELRKTLIKKGIPQSEIKKTLKTERRKAEKYLSRVKKQVCFNCRKSGHVLSDCPDLGNNALVDQSGTGICFKCGSTEHKLTECKQQTPGDKLKYASCFICREQGHLARECPDNPRGLYPRGGACKQCGDVTHLKKDCPANTLKPKNEMDVELGTISEGDIEALDSSKKTKNNNNKKKKIVKF